MSSRTLPRINEFAIDSLIRETGASRPIALTAYRTASGDYLLAKTALCRQFETNERRLRWLRHHARERAYQREQRQYHGEVRTLSKHKTEREAVAILRARVVAFQMRVGIDAMYQQEDYLVESVGRLAEGLCNAHT